MSDEQPKQDGMYRTRLYNTSDIRGGLYKLVEELYRGEGFRYIIQARNKHARSDLEINNHNGRINNLCELLEQNYQKGCRNIEVAFTTENSVVAGPYEEKKEWTYNGLNIHLGRFRINAYTNDGHIAKKLGSLKGIITHNNPDVEIDIRNIWAKLGLYLLEKMGNSVSFLRPAKRTS